MTIGAYIIVSGIGSVTGAKNKDPYLTIYGIKDEYFTDFYWLVTIFKRQIYKRGIYAWAY
jgi:hypothetical protein